MKAYVLIENNGDNCEYERNDIIMYSFNKQKLEDLAKLNNESYLLKATKESLNSIDYHNKNAEEQYIEQMKEYEDDVRSIKFYNDNFKDLITRVPVIPNKPKLLIKDEETIQHYMDYLIVQRVEVLEIED